MSLNRSILKSLVYTVIGFCIGSGFSRLSAQEEKPHIPSYPLEELSPALRPLVKTAADSSWQMDIQDILVKRAEALSIRYTSVKNTKVSLNLQAGYQGQETGGEVSDGLKYRFDFVARKPLYTWGAAEADHQFGLLQVKRVKQDRQLAFLSIYRNTVFKFIDYQVLQQRVVASELALQIVRDNLELKRDQVERGEFPETQFATLNLDYERAELTHQSLANSLQKAKNIFREDIGLEEGVDFSMGEGLPPVSSDVFIVEERVNSFLSTIEDHSLKVLAKKDRLEQENQRLKKYEVNQKPKVNAMFRLRRDSENIITGNRRNLEYTEGFAGVELNWNIYDGKNTKGYIIDSMESRRQLEREVENVEDDIRDDLNYLLADLRIQQKQSLLNEETFAWEQGRYKQKEEDVNAGRDPEKDLKVVKRDLERQRSNLYASRAYYYKTLTNLYVAMEYSSILAYLEK